MLIDDITIMTGRGQRVVLRRHTSVAFSSADKMAQLW